MSNRINAAANSAPAAVASAILKGTAPAPAAAPTAAAVKASMVAMAAELKALKGQLAAAKAAEAGPKGLSLKVSQKGAVSVYGLGKWPTTLYQSQMIRLLDASEDIRRFIEAHASELSEKPAPKKE